MILSRGYDIYLIHFTKNRIVIKLVEICPVTPSKWFSTM
jgi:hypothetical protein